MKKKGFLQISFQWLFAIIVGIVILFLTIYGITRLISTEEKVIGLKTSKEIGILLNPLETGFEEAKSSFLEFPVDTRVYATCDDFGDFGRQGIRISQKSLGKWTQAGEDIEFYNKYIFSKYPVEGRKMSLFSKPFEFPYKVANLIYMVSSNEYYCFIDAPDDIENEIENLNLENLLIEDCSESGYINVCFNGDLCDINVNYEAGEVEKGDGTVYFKSDALMYAGIFSDTQVYECQVKRLMKRVANLASLYIDKANLIAVSGCETNLNTELGRLITQARGLDNSRDLHSLISFIEEIDMKNKNNVQCKLW